MHNSQYRDQMILIPKKPCTETDIWIVNLISTTHNNIRSTALMLQLLNPISVIE